jgi:hypothetical protein
MSLPFKPYVRKDTGASLGMQACIAVEFFVTTGDLESGVYIAATSLALERSSSSVDGYARHEGYNDELITKCIGEVGRGAVEKAVRQALWHSGAGWQESGEMMDAAEDLITLAEARARELFPEAYANG